MHSATKILRNRIVLIFDFDQTLGPSTTELLFEELGVDYQPFHQELNRLIEEEMWQYPLAKAELLRQYSQKPDSPIDKEAMEKLGEKYPLYEGAEDFTERLKTYARELDEKVDLEFVLLTAGFLTIPNKTSIAKTFDRLYGGELIFDDQGKVLGAKRIISHVDKVHYIGQLQEGIELKRPSDLEDYYLDHDPEEHYVPMSQIVYVGDGASDMSAFQAVENGGGIAIAVNPEGNGKKWEGYDEMNTKRRVHNIADAEFGDEDELYKSLKLAVASRIYEIKLLRYGKGE